MQHSHIAGLNALRSYAALSVVLWHTWIHSVGWFKLPADEPFVSHLVLTGTDAVTLFLVLSGFLLTHLLLLERKQTGAVAVAAFYFRRARRILPLYYVVLIVSAVFGVAWSDAFPSAFSAFAEARYFAALSLLLGNITFVIGGMGVVIHFWTIGVECQYYILVPWLLRVKNVPRALIAVIVIRLLLLIVLSNIDPLYKLVLYLKFDAMALGGLLAWCWHCHPSLVSRLTTRKVRMVVIFVFTLAVVFEAPFHEPLYDSAMALLFGLLILNVAAGHFVVENAVVRWLADHSFGSYLWHLLVLFLLCAIGLRDVWLYIGVMIGTLGISALTFRYVERPAQHWRMRSKRHVPLGLTPITQPAPRGSG